MSRQFARKRLTALAVALGLGLLLPGGAPAADNIEIQVGVLAGAGESVWRFRSVGIELPIRGGKSWTARGGNLSYKYSPSSSNLVTSYGEKGSGSFLGLGFRLYPGAESNGWFFSANLDYVSISVDWVWSDHFNDVYGHADIVGFVPGISGGYKAVFDYGITLETSLYVGWLPAAGTDDLKASGFGGFGIALGKRF